MLFDLIRTSKPIMKLGSPAPLQSDSRPGSVGAASPGPVVRAVTPVGQAPTTSPAPASSSKPRSNRASRSPIQRRRSTPRKASTPPPQPLTPLDLLKAQITSIPPKSLHASLVSRLENASAEQVDALTALLQGLEPPPTLHCARCHANYFEEDNMSRSCVMDHDDNSTQVEYGQTLWGCCGQIVEGDGSDGPPPGWCYEGKHTTDRMKARYRDDYDSDAEEDGLQSCKQKRCKRKAEEPKVKVDPHVIVTRSQGERGPPTKRKRLS